MVALDVLGKIMSPGNKDSRLCHVCGKPFPEEEPRHWRFFWGEDEDGNLWPDEELGYKTICCTCVDRPGKKPEYREKCVVHRYHCEELSKWYHNFFIKKEFVTDMDIEELQV